jgi:hypothetical protein
MRQIAAGGPDIGVLAPREARNLGTGRKPTKLVVVTQWVRALRLKSHLTNA